MRSFLAIGRKSGLRLVFKYDLNGILRSVEFDGIWTDELIERSKVKIPANVQYCISEIKNQKPNKLGKKDLAKKSWEKMTEAERMDAILYLDEYIPLKRKEGTNIPYASSYLNGKYWES